MVELKKLFIQKRADINMKKVKDDKWNVSHIQYVLNNRRWKEKAISYAECHDQALVGDKTISFWLMDKEMYTGMTILQDPSMIIDRGIALHKLIRLVTCRLGGEGYLTFMGNEFGPPEWLDFPREGNGYSYKYCRRQYKLPFDGLLRYQHLLAFEKAMLQCEEEYQWLNQPNAYISKHNEKDFVLAFQRGKVIAQSFPETQAVCFDYFSPLNFSGSSFNMISLK